MGDISSLFVTHDSDDDGSPHFELGGEFSSWFQVHASDDGSSNISLNINMDDEGDLFPNIQCPRCSTYVNECIDSDQALFKCGNCGYHFIPEILEPLNSAEDYMRRAHNNDDHGYKKLALRDCKLALKLDPNRYDAYMIIGYIYADKGNWEVAEKSSVTCNKAKSALWRFT